MGVKGALVRPVITPGTMWLSDDHLGRTAALLLALVVCSLINGRSAAQELPGEIRFAGEMQLSGSPQVHSCDQGQRTLFWHNPFCLDPHCRYHPVPPPLLYASVEFLPLYRDQNGVLEKQPLVPGGTLALGSEDLDSEFEGGGRFLIGCSIGDCYRLEAVWVGDYNRQDTNAVQTAQEMASIGFESQLNSGEVNLRRSICLYKCNPPYGCPMTVSTMVGIRYVNHDEQMQYSAQANAISSSAMVDITHDMFGVQVGGLLQYLVYDDCAWIEVNAKGAILSNNMDIRSVYTVNQGNLSTFAGTEDRTAFLADVSLTLNYQFSPACTMRIGYNLIWLSGQALGSMNISPDPTVPLIDIDHSGEVIYHGPSIGLVLAY